MGPIPPSLLPLVFLVVVAIVAYVVRRYAGWWWLIVVWLGLNMLQTGLFVIWAYRVSPLSPEETRAFALWGVGILLPAGLALSGMVAWLVAFFVPPRTAPEEAPREGPPGRPEDTHELQGLPRRYQALLVAHREALRAVRRPWYRGMFRTYVPSYAWQDFSEGLRVSRVPDVFGRDFAAAASVLTELGELPTAQLSALEAYHRINLRRVRRRFIPARGIVGALIPALVLASRVSSVRLDPQQWPVVQTSILAFATDPQYRSFLGLLVGIVLGLIAGNIVVGWMQRRLDAFGELLTVALARRRLEVFGDPEAIERL
jgi:hypothetical protein